VNTVAAGAGSAILVLNAGSSSIKFCLFRLQHGGAVRDLRGQVSGLGTAPRFTSRNEQGAAVDRVLGDRPMSHAVALDHLLDAVQDGLDGARIVGVGHRVVHGGLEFMAPTAVDESILQRLDRYVPLAPLHQPHNLAAIRALLARLPGVPEVACFDTAFHRTVPEVAQRFALPPRFAAAGVRRYGFHGLSYEYIASRLPQVDARAANGRTVVFHLGNGASMCAMHRCQSVATTMGFTAVDGLPMGTRCGALDPGVVLFLLDELQMDARAIEQLIYHESGLLGMSGVSSDMRALLASDAPSAALALDVFTYRAGRELGSLAAALGGLDAIVFTAGIGENQAEIRQRICAHGAWLGLEVDAAANLRHGPRISTPASAVAAYVIPTDEESMIARHVQHVLDA
jgi:acetate kinase